MVFDGQYVLTAAHCIQEASFTTGNASPDLFETMEILYGANDLNNADSVRIIASVIHPDFHPFLLFNDIALLKLAEPVLDATKVACIPTTNYNLDDSFPDGNTEAFAAGWGVVLKNGQFSNGPVIKAREVKVPIVDDQTCETIYEQVKVQFDYDELHNLVDDQTICAGFEDGLNDDNELCTNFFIFLTILCGEYAFVFLSEFALELCEKSREVDEKLTIKCRIFM